MKHDKTKFTLLALALLLPAFLYHLGVVSVFLGVDEATRAMVSWEMILSGEYFTPSINGEYYFKKPPLYNWILIIFFKIFGYSEFVMRVPNILALILFGYVIFHFNKSKFSRNQAILLGLMIISCLRVIFWESYFAYIDILFSAIVYAMMMHIYKQFEKDSLVKLFLGAYVLTAFAYLLKGLPAIVFLGLSLLCLFLLKKSFKKLFSAAHFIGIGVFICILGSYYFLYQKTNGLDSIFTTLWNESLKRTASNSTILDTLKHIIVFPFEMSYHYLPWLLFIPFVFTEAGKKIFSDEPYFKYCLYLFLANIWVYWLSPNVYPKYILMLIPLVYTFSFKAYLLNEGTWKTYFYRILLFLIAALSLFSFVIPFVFKNLEIEHLIFISMGVAIGLGLLFYLALKNSDHVISLFIAALFLFRILHTDVFWIPRDHKFESFKEDADNIQKIIGEEKVYYLNWQPVQHANSFYLSHKTKKVIGIERQDPTRDKFYIVKDFKNLARPHKVYYEYRDVQKKKELKLVKFE